MHMRKLPLLLLAMQAAALMRMSLLQPAAADGAIRRGSLAMLGDGSDLLPDYARKGGTRAGRGRGGQNGRGPGGVGPSSVTAAASLLGRLTAEAFGKSRSGEPGSVKLRQFTFLCHGTHVREVNASLLPEYLALPVEQFVLYDTRLMRRVGGDVFELSLPLSAPSGRSAIHFCPTLRVRVRSEAGDGADAGSGALHFESISCRLLAEDVAEPAAEEEEGGHQGAAEAGQDGVAEEMVEEEAEKEPEEKKEENSVAEIEVDMARGQSGRAGGGATTDDALPLELKCHGMEPLEATRAAKVEVGVGGGSTGAPGALGRRGFVSRSGRGVLRRLSDRRRRVASVLRQRSLWRRSWDGDDGPVSSECGAAGERASGQEEALQEATGAEAVSARVDGTEPVQAKAAEAARKDADEEAHSEIARQMGTKAVQEEAGEAVAEAVEDGVGLLSAVGREGGPASNLVSGRSRRLGREDGGASAGTRAEAPTEVGAPGVGEGSAAAGDEQPESGALREGGMAVSLARSFDLRFNTTLVWSRVQSTDHPTVTAPCARDAPHAFPLGISLAVADASDAVEPPPAALSNAFEAQAQAGARPDTSNASAASFTPELDTADVSATSSTFGPDTASASASSAPTSSLSSATLIGRVRRLSSPVGWGVGVARWPASGAAWKRADGAGETAASNVPAPAAAGRRSVLREAPAVGDGGAAVGTRGWRAAFSGGAMAPHTRRTVGPDAAAAAHDGRVGPHDAPLVDAALATAADARDLGRDAGAGPSENAVGEYKASVARPSFAAERTQGQNAAGQAPRQGGPQKEAESGREMGAVEAGAGARVPAAEVAVQLRCTTRAEVEVGLPSPFTYAPKPLVQGAANLVSC